MRLGIQCGPCRFADHAEADGQVLPSGALIGSLLEPRHVPEQAEKNPGRRDLTIGQHLGKRDVCVETVEKGQL